MDDARPWDTRRHNYPQYYYELEQQEEDLQEQLRRQQQGFLHINMSMTLQKFLQNLDSMKGRFHLVAEPYEHEDGSKPCVGLCYYNKLQALKEQKENEQLVQVRNNLSALRQSALELTPCCSRILLSRN